MTRKDYELIARMFAKNVAKYPNYENAFKVLAIDFAEMAWAQNSRFKHDVFYKACGLTMEHSA